MFEQLKIQKQPAPQSPTQNRLQLYFQNSAFLLQQQDLALFIKDLPLINLNETKSLNTLISQLIKQNELIGQKCQQQISLLKQEYMKHDKLIRTSKEAKGEKERLEKEKRELEEALAKVKGNWEKEGARKGEWELKERQMEAETIKIGALLKEANEKVGKSEEFMAILCSEDYKKSEEFLKFNFNSIKPELLQNLEQYCQGQRRRYKSFAKVKGVVEQFCIRLDKIVKCVSPNVLASELSTETSSMVELIGEICDQDKGRKKKKRTEGSSEKTLGNSQYGSLGQRSGGFFQGMIQRLTECASNNNTSKEAIVSELEEVKNSLHQTKNYYEGTLKSLKDQFSAKEEQISKKLQLKEETIRFYEDEVQKFRENNLKLKSQIDSLNANISDITRQIGQKDNIIESQQQKIQQMEQSTQEEIERLKNEAESRVEELKKMAALKINQRQEMINQLNQRRRKDQSQHEAGLSQLKTKVKQAQEEVDEKDRQLRMQVKNVGQLQNQCQRLQRHCKEVTQELEKHQRNFNELQEKSSRRNRQVDEFKQTLNSLEHQKSLQSAYITELESKIETLTNKLKSFQQKSKSETQTKKQLTAMKNTIVQQKQRTEQYEAYCSQIKQQNQRLKAIAKQMKKELEEVYVRLAELKHIEAERERLFLEAQESERARDGLLKEYQEIKFQMLKLEAENKKMHLELKHFRNVVGRIKFLQEDS